MMFFTFVYTHTLRYTTLRTTLHYATHYATRLLYILPGAVFSVMNKPFSFWCGALMNLCIHFRIRPFVLLLTHNVVLDSAFFNKGQRFVSNQTAILIAPYVFFHAFNSSATHCAMFGPILVAFAMFVFLPVTAQPFVSAHAFP